MQINFTNQTALEVSQWLSDKANPQQNYPSVSTSRAALRVRKVLEEAVKDYSDVFKTLVQQDQDELKKCQDELKQWEVDFVKTQDLVEEEKVAKVQELQKAFEITRKTLQDAAIDHESTLGSVPVVITLAGKYPEKDWKAVKSFFETNGQKFPMWQIGDKLETIAQVFDEN